MRLPLARPLVAFCSLLSSLFLTLSSVAAQTPPQEAFSLDDALRQLADRVAAIPHRGPLRLQFFQDLAFAAETGKDWQSFFLKELERLHLPLSDDPTASLLRIGVAETPTQLVLSASLRAAEKDDVRLITFPRTNFRAAALPVVPVRLEKQLVYQATDRLLDASSLSYGAQSGLVLLVYRSAEVSLLRLDATGTVQQIISVTAREAPLSRDPRGELTLHSGEADVTLSGKYCQFTWVAPADLKCRFTKTTWRSPTVLTSPCDAGDWKLLADGLDWTTPDLLQAVPESSPERGSTAILSDFPGPILNISGQQNPSSALVITRNLRTGDYEVYKITLVCGN